MFGAADEPFSTDYYSAPAGLAWNAAVNGLPPTQTPTGHPALPALWWVGMIIALIAIRVASEYAS